MVHIYILELENNKFYIGKTNSPDMRLNDHFNANGSIWTKKYKPLSILRVISDCDDFDEDKYTLMCMKEYGIDNVRGGSFCTLELPDDQVKTINKMIVSSSDKCYACGNSGHFVKDCLESKLSNYFKNVDDDNLSDKVSKVKSIYEEIINLEQIISDTNKISINDIEKIKRLNSNSEEQTLRNRSGRLSAEDNNNIILKRLIYATACNYFYKNMQHTTLERTGRNIDILALEIIKLNLEQKKRLKEIYTEYYNKTFVETLLTRLYKMEIEILQTEIANQEYVENTIK